MDGRRRNRVPNYYDETDDVMDDYASDGEGQRMGYRDPMLEDSLMQGVAALRIADDSGRTPPRGNVEYGFSTAQGDSNDYADIYGEPEAGMPLQGHVGNEFSSARIDNDGYDDLYGVRRRFRRAAAGARRIRTPAAAPAPPEGQGRRRRERSPNEGVDEESERRRLAGRDFAARRQNSPGSDSGSGEFSGRDGGESPLTLEQVRSRLERVRAFRRALNFSGDPEGGGANDDGWPTANGRSRTFPHSPGRSGGVGRGFPAVQLQRNPINGGAINYGRIASDISPRADNGVVRIHRLVPDESAPGASPRSYSAPRSVGVHHRNLPNSRTGSPDRFGRRPDPTSNGELDNSHLRARVFAQIRRDEAAAVINDHRRVRGIPPLLQPPAPRSRRRPRRLERTFVDEFRGLPLGLRDQASRVNIRGIPLLPTPPRRRPWPRPHAAAALRPSERLRGQSAAAGDETEIEGPEIVYRYTSGGFVPVLGGGGLDPVQQGQNAAAVREFQAIGRSRGVSPVRRNPDAGAREEIQRRNFRQGRGPEGLSDDEVNRRARLRFLACARARRARARDFNPGRERREAAAVNQLLRTLEEHHRNGMQPPPSEDLIQQPVRLRLGVQAGADPDQQDPAPNDEEVQEGPGGDMNEEEDAHERELRRLRPLLAQHYAVLREIQQLRLHDSNFGGFEEQRTDIYPLPGEIPLAAGFEQNLIPTSPGQTQDTAVLREAAGLLPGSEQAEEVRNSAENDDRDALALQILHPREGGSEQQGVWDHPGPVHPQDEFQVWEPVAYPQDEFVVWEPVADQQDEFVLWEPVGDPQDKDGPGQEEQAAQRGVLGPEHPWLNMRDESQIWEPPAGPQNDGGALEEILAILQPARRVVNVQVLQTNQDGEDEENEYNGENNQNTPLTFVNNNAGQQLQQQEWEAEFDPVEVAYPPTPYVDESVEPVITSDRPFNTSRDSALLWGPYIAKGVPKFRGFGHREAWIREVMLTGFEMRKIQRAREEVQFQALEAHRMEAEDPFQRQAIQGNLDFIPPDTSTSEEDVQGSESSGPGMPHLEPDTDIEQDGDADNEGTANPEDNASSGQEGAAGDGGIPHPDDGKSSEQEGITAYDSALDSGQESQSGMHRRLRDTDTSSSSSAPANVVEGKEKNDSESSSSVEGLDKPGVLYPRRTFEPFDRAVRPPEWPTRGPGRNYVVMIGDIDPNFYCYYGNVWIIHPGNIGRGRQFPTGFIHVVEQQEDFEDMGVLHGDLLLRVGAYVSAVGEFGARPDAQYVWDPLAASTLHSFIDLNKRVDVRPQDYDKLPCKFIGWCLRYNLVKDNEEPPLTVDNLAPLSTVRHQPIGTICTAVFKPQRGDLIILPQAWEDHFDHQENFRRTMLKWYRGPALSDEFITDGTMVVRLCVDREFRSDGYKRMGEQDDPQRLRPLTHPVDHDYNWGYVELFMWNGTDWLFWGRDKLRPKFHLATVRNCIYYSCNP